MCVFVDEELDDKKPLIVSGMKILLNEQSLKVMEREEGGREGGREGGEGGREGGMEGREREGGREREAHKLLLLFFQ